jgi:hypothetical protein
MTTRDSSTVAEWGRNIDQSLAANHRDTTSMILQLLMMSGATATTMTASSSSSSSSDISSSNSNSSSSSNSNSSGRRTAMTMSAEQLLQPHADIDQDENDSNDNNSNNNDVAVCNPQGLVRRAALIRLLFPSTSSGTTGGERERGVTDIGITSSVSSVRASSPLSTPPSSKAEEDSSSTTADGPPVIVVGAMIMDGSDTAGGSTTTTSTTTTPSHSIPHCHQSTTTGTTGSISVEGITNAMTSEYDTLTNLVAQKDASAIGWYILSTLGHGVEGEKKETGNSDGTQSAPSCQSTVDSDDHAVALDDPVHHLNRHQDHANEKETVGGEPNSTRVPVPNYERILRPRQRSSGSTRQSTKRVRRPNTRSSGRQPKRRTTEINSAIAPRRTLRSRSSSWSWSSSGASKSSASPQSLTHAPKILPQATHEQDHCVHSKGTRLAIQWTDDHYYEAIFRGYHRHTRTNVLSHVPKITNNNNSSSSSSCCRGSSSSSHKSSTNPKQTAIGKGGKKSQRRRVETNTKEENTSLLRPIKDEKVDEDEEMVKALTLLSRTRTKPSTTAATARTRTTAAATRTTTNSTTTTTQEGKSRESGKEIWCHVTYVQCDTAQVVDLTRLNYFVANYDEIRLDENDYYRPNDDSDTEHQDDNDRNASVVHDDCQVIVKEEQKDENENDDDDDDDENHRSHPSTPDGGEGEGKGGDYQLGDRVAIRWRDGSQYMGTITKIRKSDSDFFYVTYDDDDECWHKYQDLSCSSLTGRRRREPHIVIFPQRRVRYDHSSDIPNEHNNDHVDDDNDDDDDNDNDEEEDDDDDDNENDHSTSLACTNTDPTTTTTTTTRNDTNIVILDLTIDDDVKDKVSGGRPQSPRSKILSQGVTTYYW